MKKLLTILALIISACATAQTAGDYATFRKAAGIGDAKTYLSPIINGLLGTNGSGAPAFVAQSTFAAAAHTHTFASLTSKPTTIAGYGITDFNSLGDARWSLLAHTHTFASLTSKPTTLLGYGITDGLTVAQADLLYDPLTPNRPNNATPDLSFHYFPVYDPGDAQSEKTDGVEIKAWLAGEFDALGSAAAAQAASQPLDADLTAYANAADAAARRALIGAGTGSGTVTSVTGTSPIASSGGTTPAISIANAAADGTTKGAASFTASDFNATSGNISIDYANGQTAAGLTKGFLAAVDFNTFNSKQSAITFGTGVQTALGVNIGSAGAPVLFNGAGGTPSSIVLTNATGTAASLTAGTASAVAVGGITGLGTGVGTALAVNTGSAGSFVVNGGALGTPSGGVATNLTGTASGLSIGGNAATVTTNANLTGPVTSVGNATTIADAELAAIAGLTSAADKGIQFTGSGTAATYDLTTAGKALLDDASTTAQRVTLGNVQQTAYKASTTSRVNNTLTADPDLQIALAASQKISGTMNVYITGSAAGDFKYRITGPAGFNNLFVAASWLTSGTVTTSNLTSQAYDAADRTAVAAADFIVRLNITFIVDNGATPGTFQLEWAQNTTAAGNASAVLVGSQIQYISF
jgi:hypothetical protein